MKRRTVLATAALAATSAFAKPLMVGVADMCMDEATSSVKIDYVKAVADGGHLPVIIPRCCSGARLEAIVAKLDLLLLCGGEDLEPSLYGAKPSPALGTVNKTRDSFEMRVVAAARKRRLPMIGICRGCQLLNVAFGGTLWQDIPNEHPAKTNHRNVTHKIKIATGSKLAAAFGSETAEVNSTHHQAVKDVAPGFRAVAVAPDGVIEAIESADYPAIGMQFHPERLPGPEGKSLLSFLLKRLFPPS